MTAVAPTAIKMIAAEIIATKTAVVDAAVNMIMGISI